MSIFFEEYFRSKALVDNNLGNHNYFHPSNEKETIERGKYIEMGTRDEMGLLMVNLQSKSS